MKIIGRFIPEPFLSDRKIRTSAHLILTIDFLILGISLFLLPIFYSIGFLGGALVISFAIICAIVYPFLLYFTQDLILCGNFFAFASWSVFTGLISLSGGLHSPFLIWFVTIPPVCLYYLKKPNSYFWVTLTIGSILGMGICEILDYRFPKQLSLIYFPYAIWFSYGMVILVLGSVAKTFLVVYGKVNQKLKESNSNLKASNLELERFAYIASHDLKSPLRNIASFANLMERRCKNDLDENGRDYLKMILTNARQMHHLVEDILEYSKTTNKEIKQEEIDLNKLLKNLSIQLKLDPRFSKARIIVNPMPRVLGDFAMFSQLFQNLIENGLKYNNSNKPIIAIHFIQEANKLHFTIIDNGIGISDEYREQIFEMFKRLHTQDNYSGTGIGLAICKKIVAHYQGEIWVESPGQNGSIFHIILPNEIQIENKKMGEKLVTAQ